MLIRTNGHFCCQGQNVKMRILVAAKPILYVLQNWGTSDMCTRSVSQLKKVGRYTICHRCHPQRWPHFFGRLTTICYTLFRGDLPTCHHTLGFLFWSNFSLPICCVSQGTGGTVPIPSVGVRCHPCLMVRPWDNGRNVREETKCWLRKRSQCHSLWVSDYY